MKLLKVGRSASCDIVLPSENVSSLHAEILVLDNGEIYIEDKNSSNGTKVGNKLIAPNVEVPIHPGDYVVLADMELPWNRVPKAENLSMYKQVFNIGTNFKNDIVIEGTFCSRYHASLRISRNGRKAFIRDSNSKNGVKVNGVKIQPNKDVEIKKSDVVVCGDTDISEELKPYIPNHFAVIKKTGLGVGILALLCLVSYFAFKFISKPPTEIVSPLSLRPATVYVYTQFDYVVAFQDNPLPPSVWDGILKIPHTIAGEGTAFFIDSLGHLATNRHVAVPWEYRDADDDNFIRNEVEKWLAQLREIDRTKTVEAAKIDYQYNLSSNIGRAIDKMTKNFDEMNAVIARIKKSSYTVSGNVTHRFVGYPGRNYTSPVLEMERCDLVLESGTRDKDIAILQLNTKKTPKDIARIFRVEDFRLEPLEPLKEELYTIGYPMGLRWGLDNQTQSLEPFIRSLRCSKIPSTYDFEFQGESVGGASGSPIFDKQGRLAGVLWGGWAAGTTYGKACQAKWLKQLYKKAIGEID